MTKNLYRGFSTHQYETTRSFQVADVELVKLDLLNHIFTQRGDRVMMPTFGTRIPSLVFEPLDEVTLAIIEDDLRAVFTLDPRVELQQLTVTPDYDNHSVYASAVLYYIELQLVGPLDINITFNT